MSRAMPEPSAAERRLMIERRCQRSLVWRVIHWLGSLQLALVLLATIAIACAVATFAESSFNTKVAQAYIYKAPWFLAWLGVLCVNLFAVTLTRWPWQKRHAGFIITHYGIILLLAGAIVGMTAGFEGNVTLRKGGEPLSRVLLNRSILQFRDPSSGSVFITPFDADATRPTQDRPKRFAIPGTGLQAVADAASGNLIRRRILTAGDRPGILLRFHSDRLSQTVEIPLVLHDSGAATEDFFGLAKVSFQATLPPPAPDIVETQMVFSKFAPVVHADSRPSGLHLTLSGDGSSITATAPDGTAATFARKDIMHTPVNVGEAVVTVEDYWPDFAMKDGRPATLSPIPNNPAVLARISTSASEGDVRPALLLAPSDRGVRYRLERGGKPYADGDLERGSQIQLGWADWVLTLADARNDSAESMVLEPGPPSAQQLRGTTGIRMHLEAKDGTKGAPVWIGSGGTTPLTLGNQTVQIGYGLEVRPVPFSLQLLQFEVPRYEGTATPSNFISTVQFTNASTAATKVATAKMNHPASYPGGLLASMTGLNYKFSQAGWDPDNLDQTTLQVLYDPGWLLKWTGSMGICVGIAIMFYFKPGRGRPSRPERVTPVV